MKLLNALVLFMAGCLVGLPASAQFPERPVRIVVPYPPGGTSDVLVRIFAPAVERRLKQTVIVDNRPGGSGVIGVMAVASAAPDGYTLLLANSGTHGVNSALIKRLPYDPIKDFTAITLLGSPPNVLLANPKVGAASIAEFLSRARSRPGTLNIGTTSLGGSPHMSGELIKLQEKLDFALIAYKGAGPMLNDLIGGQIEYGIDNLPSSIGHIRGGTLRALAVTTSRRWPGLPDVPTLAESGVSGIDVSGWFGLFAPAGTPKPIVDAIYAATAAALKDPELVKRFQDVGAEPGGNPPEAFARQVAGEVAKWKAVVEATGIKVE